MYKVKVGGYMLNKGKVSKIQIGVGTASGEDAYSVTLKAAKDSLKGLKEKPNISIVIADSNYNEKQILKAGNEVFGKNWIGSSTDTQITSVLGYERGAISVLSIFSEYLHFGIGYTDNYHKNPVKAGENAINGALKNIHVDKYVDPYIQFRRTQTKSYHDIVRVPPYFILTLVCGVKYAKGNVVPGMESEFLEGIVDVIGPNIPIIGGSTSTDFDKYMKDKLTNNFQFAEGKLFYDSGIVVFVVSNLYFSHSFTHGYVGGTKVALITKVDKSGHIIEEINNKPAVEEYANLLGISVDELMKDPFKYTLPRPLGVLDAFANIYIKEAVPNPDKKTMYCLTKVIENSAMVVVDYNPKTTKEAVYKSIKEADEIHDDKEIALGLVFSCCGRKALLGKEVKDEIEIAKKKYKVPLFGFHTFGEIGAKMNKPSQVCNQSVSTLLVYNRLLTE